VNFIRWNERAYSDWDYAAFAVTGMTPELLKNKKAFPPKNTVYQIKADGAPIGIVLKREDRSDLYGHQAMQAGRIGEAISYLKQALDYNEYNEQSLDDLINIYIGLQMTDSALALAQHWVNFNKGNTIALNHLANLCYGKGDFANALTATQSITKCNPRDISGFWLAAHIHLQQNRPDDALRCLSRLLRIRGDFKPAYQLMAQIYEQAGDTQKAQQILKAISK
jgi:tetratricopeptide (TPR) repeat protein